MSRPLLQIVSDESSPSLSGTTDGFVFEALFLRGLQTPEGLRLALSGIGVELERLERRYPSPVWIAAIDLARSYLSPADGDEGDTTERALGRACFVGTLRTVSGRLLAATIPLMTPRSLLSRVGLYMRMGRDDLQIEFDEADGWLTLDVRDPASARPQFFAGILEAALDKLGARYELVVEPRDELRFSVRVRLVTSA